MPPDAPAGYVVDTNVLSNRGDVERNPVLAEWLRRHAGRVRISVVTIAEMHRGLILLEAKIAAIADRKVKAREIGRLARKRSWYVEVSRMFADHIESVDRDIAEKWAEVSVRFPSLRDADKLIAATALVRGYGVATENTGHFRQAGMPIVNPFDVGSWDDGSDDDPVSPLLDR